MGPRVSGESGRLEGTEVPQMMFSLCVGAWSLFCYCVGIFVGRNLKR